MLRRPRRRLRERDEKRRRQLNQELHVEATLRQCPKVLSHVLGARHEALDPEVEKLPDSG